MGLKPITKTLPLVSVVVTTYNRCRYLTETLASIHNQTYNNIEILLIDDGSTSEIAIENKKMASAFSTCVYYYKKNSGQPDSRNYGIKKAKGAYIAFCDDDDYWSLDKLEQQVPILIQQPEYGVISGWVALIDAEGKPLGKEKKYTGYNKGYIFYKNLERNCLSSATPLVRKEVFEKVGYFNTNFTIGEDWEFWRRVSYYYKFQAVDNVIAYYRHHGMNMTAKGIQDSMERIVLYRKLTKSLLEWGRDRFLKKEKKVIRDYEWKFYRKILTNHFPSIMAKLNFFTKIMIRSYTLAMHIMYLFLFAKKVKER